jgi:hypothetical protein
MGTVVGLLRPKQDQAVVVPIGVGTPRQYALKLKVSHSAALQGEQLWNLRTERAMTSSIGSSAFPVECTQRLVSRRVSTHHATSFPW